MRLIDADALADALFDKRKNYPQWVADIIGKMPDAVVRCFNCKHFQWGDPDDETIFCGLHGRCYRWDFFCADGERKDT